MSAFTASWLLVIAFTASWIGAAMWVSRGKRTPTPRELLPLYGGGAVAVLALTVAAQTIPALWIRMWPEHLLFDWVMVILCAAGFAFCWWARLHIGKLWSSGVVVREGHRVVDTGPYAIVRHPIYSGGFLAGLAFMAIRARPIDFAVILLVVVFFSLKARVEERFLRSEFGSDYDAYSARVPMLVPGLRFAQSGETAGGSP